MPWAAFPPPGFLSSGGSQMGSLWFPANSNLRPNVNVNARSPAMDRRPIILSKVLCAERSRDKIQIHCDPTFNFSLDEWECARCPATDWCPLQNVFPPHAQCSWNNESTDFKWVYQTLSSCPRVQSMWRNAKTSQVIFNLLQHNISPGEYRCLH